MSDAGLLDIADKSFSAITDARFGDFVIGHRVIKHDVFGADDTGHFQNALFIVQAKFLPSVDDHVAVWQNLRHNGGNAKFDVVLAVGCSGVVVV